MIRIIKFYYLIVDCTHTSTHSSKYVQLYMLVHAYRVSGIIIIMPSHMDSFNA